MMPFDPLSLLGAISLGIEAVRYAKAHASKKERRKLADELRELYFDRKLFDDIAVDNPDWEKLEQSAMSRLWNSRNSVSDALIRMEEDGFLNQLSLRDQRLFQELTRSKRVMRLELIDAIRSGSLRHDTAYREQLMAQVKQLNLLIEDLDPVN